MGSTRRRFGAVLWVACVCLAIAALAWHATEPGWLRSDVFDLLPRSERDALQARAVASAERELSGRLLFLIGHEDRETARAAADRFVEALGANDLIDRLAVYSEERLSAFSDFYFPRRRRILTEQQIAGIDSGDGRDAVQDALATIYSPISAVSGAVLREDPFLLFPQSMRSLQPSTRSLGVDGGYPWVEQDGVDYAFVSARTQSATLDLGSQRRLVRDIESLSERLAAEQPGTRVLKTGFLFYANAGAESARTEISIIGGGSLIGIVILILACFRSARPLWLALLTIASGCLIALALTLVVFGSVHLFTLVFGASLIGVSIDYTFHYLAEELFGGSQWRPEYGLRRVLPGITLGLITSVIAYSALTVAPFPGLQELAVFSSGGLIGAYATLLCCAMWLPRASGTRRRPVLARLSSGYVRFWESMPATRRWVAAAAFGALALAGALAVELDDDISILQNRPLDLQREEARIAELLGEIPGNAFLLVSAPSAEETLKVEERLRGGLDELAASGALHDYLAVSRTVPSAARQRRSVEAYSALVDARLAELHEALGVPDAATGVAREALTRPVEAFSVDEWLSHPVSEELRSLWIGRVGQATGSIVLLEGIDDLAAVREVADGFPGVTVVDKASELSRLLGAYRVRVSWLLAAGYVGILLLLALRYGPGRAAIVLIPPLLAGAAAFGAASLPNAPANLFNVLALILVLGIGIDYTLFIAESRGEIESTIFAITLAAATTILSFGLLALSETFAIRSFGLTVLVGIACSYLLAPLALTARARS